MSRGSEVMCRIFFVAFLFLASCTSSATPEAAPTESPAEAASPPEVEVTVAGIREHLDALQEIADQNDGIRAAGTPGYDASARYVARTLRSAGYEVRLDEWKAPVFEQHSATVLEAPLPGGRKLEDDRDLRAMLYSGSGSVRAPLFKVSFDPDGIEREGPGCDPGVFEGAPAGAVMLLRPGPCFTRDQVVNAQEAGAGAVLVAYPEFTSGDGLRRPTLITPDGIDVPALAITDAAGRRLDALASGTMIRVAVDARNPMRLLRNVIAESPDGSALQVVMAGGHLDSVIDGPGINDNGSGVATLIEIAQELAETQPRNKLRFAFWAGEEYGLLGSRQYVDSLSSLEVRDVAAYLNFDMLASPNYVPLVYDNSGAPEGSGSITTLFMDVFEEEDEPAEPIDLTGRSDHFAFEQAGIPVGGLFSGAEEIKTEDEAADHGGRVGEQLDACYHQDCDDISNINDEVLDVFANAAADVIAALAEDARGLIATGGDED